MNEIIIILVGLAALAALLRLYADFTGRQDLEVFSERAIMGIGTIVILIIFLSNDGSDSSSSSNVKPKISNMPSSYSPLSGEEDKQLRLDAYHDCLDYEPHSFCSDILED